ncbi:hypothetical protein EX30DRAFT_364256 [Ascodesmis nigricans]|uniref:LITAF domain-containing protein n=1 Tax=Ascodesmis nigricans TaxID=341454 RepID=A0A4S2MWI9_9PEZI|nr:hypothetical protein EX30DRAFT_364256 [Ascodesmis nigricans]
MAEAEGHGDEGGVGGGETDVGEFAGDAVRMGGGGAEMVDDDSVCVLVSVVIGVVVVPLLHSPFRTLHRCHSCRHIFTTTSRFYVPGTITPDKYPRCNHFMAKCRERNSAEPAISQ